MLDQGKGFSLSEIQFMVNSEEESNSLNEDVKCILIEEFGHNIKFSESERKNESQFVLLLAATVEDVIKSLLEVDYNLDGNFATHKISNNLGDRRKYLVSCTCFNDLKQSKIYTRWLWNR